VLPKQDPFIRPSRVVYQSCAVVGSSGMHLFHRRGDFIDSHEAVIRFNAAPTVRVNPAARLRMPHRPLPHSEHTEHDGLTGGGVQAGFEEFVGSKTTVRFVNRMHFGYQEKPSEAVLQQVTTPEVLKEFIAQKQEMPAQKLFMVAPDFHRCVHTLTYTDAKVANRTDFEWELAHAAVSRRQHPISLYTIVARTHIHTYAAKVWDLCCARRYVVRQLAAPPTNGLYGVFFALQRCRSITLVGFVRGGDAHVPYHYFDTDAPVVNQRRRDLQVCVALGFGTAMHQAYDTSRRIEGFQATGTTPQGLRRHSCTTGWFSLHNQLQLLPQKPLGACRTTYSAGVAADPGDRPLVPRARHHGRPVPNARRARQHRAVRAVPAGLHVPDRNRAAGGHAGLLHGERPRGLLLRMRGRERVSGVRQLNRVRRP
jgi:hypothetical protein